MYTFGTIANSKRTPTEKKKQKCCYYQIKTFSETSGTVRYLKIFTINSKEMAV